jgi:hypothetical protein
MRLAILSDIHGNSIALVIGAYNDRRPGRAYAAMSAQAIQGST